jgi:hypothetical protein
MFGLAETEGHLGLMNTISIKGFRNSFCLILSSHY